MKNKIIQILGKAGLFSPTYTAKIADKAMEIIGDSDVDIDKFNAWIEKLNFSTAKNITGFFICCLKKAIDSKEFMKTTFTEVKPMSVEDFEKEWDEWCEVIRELSLDPENLDVPGKGILIGELHCVDGVRGISTGDGGFVYLDGTVSQRFKKFEDLTIQEKEDLINAFDERNSKPGGRLIIADALIEKMRSLAGGSAV